jgi:hypothetical protein
MTTNKIACIGARETPQNILDDMSSIWELLASKWYTIASGNAKWADEYFAKWANKIDPTKVSLYLPWKNLNEHLQNKLNHIEVWWERTDVDSSLEEVHKGWKKVKDYVRQLHRRNYGIVQNSLCVICYTIDWTDRGWTGVGIRLAQKMWIPVFNLYEENCKENFFNFLKSIEDESIVKIDENSTESLIEFAEKLFAEQVPLSPEIQKIIDKEFHNLV